MEKEKVHVVWLKLIVFLDMPGSLPTNPPSLIPGILESADNHRATVGGKEPPSVTDA